MKKFNLIFIASIISFLNITAQTDTQLKLWYLKPAKEWVEALPIGNGRLGAMVYGNPVNETIQLNENTIWAGSPNRNDNPLAKDALPEVRKLIFEGKNKEAQSIINQKFISKTSHGMPYQIAGNLKLQFPGHENYSNYYRELNIENAVETYSYVVDGTKFTTRIFASHPDEVIVMQIATDKPGAVNFSAMLNRPAPVNIFAKGTDELVMAGTTNDHETVKGAVQFETHIKIKTSGGAVTATDSSLNVSGASVATIYISIGTNFKAYNDISGNAAEKAETLLQQALKKTYEQILSDHVSDFQSYFKRVSLDLGVTDSVKNPTNVRLEQFAKGYDPQLVALYFQYGRYLLISSSRPGGQPANLQGIWANQLRPPWDSKYTVNINTEMNYWPSEITNLTEMNEPLVAMLHELSQTGQQTARDMYGAGGWVLHHNTDIWRINGPVDGATWGMWPMGGAWLSQHLYEKYEYSGDMEYLKSVYPIMKGASQFFLDFLAEEPEHHWLVVSPSISPENAPASVGSSISAGTTMDNQLVFDLFSKTIKTAEILKTDAPLVAQLQERLKRLPPMQIGKWGQLQEWMHDLDSPDDKHRHVSHLYGLFPSGQISATRNPELFSAVKTSLLARGDESTGWSMGWKVNLWAYLLDGDHAMKLITDQLTPSIQPDGKQRGGTYPNLFDAHPPFQIDGNFGCTSGIAEMLLQSQDGVIQLLPALPTSWKKGSVSGLRTRGGFLAIIAWENGEVSKATITSKLGGNCRIRSYIPLKGKGVKVAKGTNSNSFFSTLSVEKPLNHAESPLPTLNLRKTYEYDIVTKPGETIELQKL